MFAMTGIVLILFGRIANEYGTLAPYGTPGVLCLVQVCYPTMLGWGFVVTLYAVASSLYVYALGADAIRLTRGQQAQVFVNPVDSTVFLVLDSVLIMLTLAVASSRPVRSTQAVKSSHVRLTS
jgi:hypothetical protein